MRRLRLIGLFAWRYTLPSSGDNYASLILVVSFTGMALGVAVLIIVASVMNGFGKELRHRILGTVPHVTVHSDLSPRQLAALPGVQAVSRFASADAILSQGQKVSLVSVYGVEPEKEARMSIIPQHMVSGRLDALAPGKRQVILGRTLAWQLGLRRGDDLLLLLPVVSGAEIRPRPQRLRVAGMFEVGAEVDAGVALVNLEDLLALDPQLAAGLRLRLQDSGRARALAGELLRLAPGARVTDWTRRYGDLFTAVQMEKTMMFLLLFLTVAIALFNVLSGLVMLVNEKKGEIAILNTMGLGSRDLVYIFQLRGLLLAIPGNLLGVALGCLGALHVTELMSLLETLLGAPFLGGSYFTRVPSELQLTDVAAVVSLTLLMSLLATLFPARHAASLAPAAVLGGN